MYMISYQNWNHNYKLKEAKVKIREDESRKKRDPIRARLDDRYISESYYEEEKLMNYKAKLLYPRWN